ncbi:hypothetical protein ZYGR_0AD02540 [Zygosaccharomyces rouxii]|uniref:ZYRO0G11858p n=2 Tax=Zygosaccharomyces rouxii TaxID=4956 RepID=C5E0D7_ZYGRC|nr:uncharacterized protein ZYRO0G11858g [Zygosaccharomyces rouxii]KAH9202564.1 hypothetical protein LQ764DRAFT_207536 [Zygosaccharomyces rouxii]GAV51071.1 hypothetical protein ZYGR_0AD02540 [Zygosaccharomyces rouxii]CAR29571.1 ZYRO0G11858p [Zygosaccharomyces rouxii]
MAEGLCYEELIDHIIANKPIPNVVQVPEVTYDESERTHSELKPRPKPWEMQEKVEEAPLVNEPLQDPSQLPSNIRLSEELRALTRSQSIESLSNYYAREAELDAALENDNR